VDHPVLASLARTHDQLALAFADLDVAQTVGAEW
jgi:hypothetical protein